MKNKILRKLNDKSLSKKIRSVMFSIFIALVSLVSIFNVSSDFIYSLDLTDASKLSDLRDLQLSEIETKMKEDYERLYAQNNELVAMLNVPNMGYFPIMFSGDQKYINTDFDGSYKFAGVPFMNKNSMGNFDGVSLIHAHTMRDGSMFSSLRNFKDQEFFQKNPPITVYDGKHFYYYKPFTVLNIQDGTEFIKQQEMSKDEQAAYLQSLKDRSMVKMEEGSKLDFTKDALFLQTCDYNFYNSRLVVGGSLIHKKESGVK